jgi:hypothetical protein
MPVGDTRLQFVLMSFPHGLSGVVGCGCGFVCVKTGAGDAGFGAVCETGGGATGGAAGGGVGVSGIATADAVGGAAGGGSAGAADGSDVGAAGTAGAADGADDGTCDGAAEGADSGVDATSSGEPDSADTAMITRLAIVNAAPMPISTRFRFLRRSSASASASRLTLVRPGSDLGPTTAADDVVAGNGSEGGVAGGSGEMFGNMSAVIFIVPPPGCSA